MLVTLYNNGNISFDSIEDTFANISDIMTAWIRTHGNTTYSEDATGQVLHYATCLSVRWLWLSFPAALALLTPSFLIIVAVIIHRQNAPVWKSSVLTWIMHGASGFSSNKAIDGIATTAAMELAAKQIVVTLVKGLNPQIQLVDVNNEQCSGLRQLDEERIDNPESSDGTVDMIDIGRMDSNRRQSDERGL